MAVETDIVRHYTHGSLDQAILAGLRATGRDVDRIDPADLAAIDEFHMGGGEATAAVAGELDLKPGMAMLDIGSGIGGPARYFARTFGVMVHGVDLTPEYVRVAAALSERAGLADRVKFQVGSGVDLPFEAGTFDAATLLHVGMNIPDKRRLFREVHRVLKPGGVLAVYDPMRTNEGAFDFPVPWASEPGFSFLETPDSYRDALSDAGFVVGAEVSRREMGLEFFRRIRARIAESGPPPLGLHILMGPETPAKIANLVAALEKGIVAPVEMISRRAA